MASIERYIPFILHFAAGVPKADVEGGRYSNAELFEKARKKGWSDDPDDAGGQTMVDVTLATYKGWCRANGRKAPAAADLRSISYEDWRDVLKSLFWDKWNADTIPSQGLANLVVDWAWGSGATGIKRVQRILNVAADGFPGPKTMQAMFSRDADKLFDRIAADRIRHAREIVSARPANRKFWNGWMRRYNSITKTGFDISLKNLWAF